VADRETGAATADEAELADVERRRLRALVDADVAAAHELHADDFQLITPGGRSLSKDEFLGEIASGEVDYLVWEPEEIEVRVHANGGCLRYRATIEIITDGEKIGPDRLWHTDFYEKQKGRWRVVWSQATRIRG
jgi:hypothetical protein